MEDLERLGTGWGQDGDGHGTNKLTPLYLKLIIGWLSEVVLGLRFFIIERLKKNFFLRII